MALYDVHSYSVVRFKFTNIEAPDQKAAIAAVEADSTLTAEAAALISYDKPGSKIAAIEVDEGAPAVGYLVDEVGDDEYVHSNSYDVDRFGNVVTIGKRPGENVPLNKLQRAALEGSGDLHLETLVAEAPDQFTLLNQLELEFDDHLPAYILKALAHVMSPEEALKGLDRAIDALRDARRRIENEVN